MATVLVVEDCSEFRAAIKLMVESGGHRVIEAGDGRAGAAALGDEAVEVVITDILMPEMDGIEVLKEAARRRPALPVIAISGGGHLISAVESLSLARLSGARQVLYKPFRKHELLSAIDDALGAAQK